MLSEQEFRVKSDEALTAARQQVRSSILDDIEWQSTHNTHQATYLETTQHFALPTTCGPSLALPKRQVKDRIALQVMRAVVGGGSAVSLFLRNVCDSRPTIVVCEVQCFGPRVSHA